MIPFRDPQILPDVENQQPSLSSQTQKESGSSPSSKIEPDIGHKSDQPESSPITVEPDINKDNQNLSPEVKDSNPGFVPPTQLEKAFFRNGIPFDIGTSFEKDVSKWPFDKLLNSNTYQTLRSIGLDIEQKLRHPNLQRVQNNFYHKCNFVVDKLIAAIDHLDFEDNIHLDTKPSSSIGNFCDMIKNREFGSLTLKYFPVEDLNFNLKDLLPAVVTDSLWPLNVNTGEMNFYNSFCKGYLACENGGSLFQRAVAHRVITEPMEFANLCDMFEESPESVLEAIRFGHSTTHTELGVLSKIVDRNITVITFDEYGNIMSNVFYDLNKHGSHTIPTTYLGCIANETKTFFPLIRKQGLTSPPFEATTCAFASIITEHNKGKNDDAGNKQALFRNTTITDVTEENLNLNIPLSFSSHPSFNSNETRQIRKKDTNDELKEVSTKPLNSDVVEQKQAANEDTLTGVDYKPVEDNEEKNQPVRNTQSKTRHSLLQDPLPSTISRVLPRNNGLPNIGNTCYFNAIMQSLLSIPYLRVEDLPKPFRLMNDLIFKEHKNDKSIKQATLEAFTNFNVMLKNKLILGHQEDCHDVLSTFFGLPESLTLHPYLEIRSIQTLKCSNCSYESTREEPTLQLSVSPNIRIQDAINASCIIEEQRNYKCAQCEKSGESFFSSFVAKSPPVLLLFTKLFNEFTNFKIPYNEGYKPSENYVVLPLIDRLVSYKISSFITHTGRDRNAGHYKAYVRHENGWISCNDSVVSTISQPILNEDEHVYVQFLLRDE